VLVIEDDRDALDNLRDILELDDFTVDTALSAAEALKNRDWSGIDAVILDRKLPDGTADDLLPRLKRLAPGAAYVIVTGTSDIDGAIAALRVGAADYLLKPINPEALRIRLGRLMEQRRLALAQARAEAVFRQLVESAECMIVILRPDFAIAYFSPHAERLTGYPAPEILGRGYIELFVPELDRQQAAERLRAVLGGTPARGIEGRVVCRDGRVRLTVGNASALADYQGAPALLLVENDITELKQAQERALQSERLAAVGQMSAGLAHEGRNALQRTQACLEMLALKVEGEADLLGLIARIQKAQDDLRKLFDDVKGYAAPVVLDRTRCDVSAVWREAWAQLDGARAAKSATLREQGSGTSLHCLADPFRLGQVFRNIFDNALAACPGPAEIEVTAADSELDGQPAIRISICDNGPGLTPESRQRIFESFYTTKTKGTGLGMAIVKRIIEAHGGQITAGNRTHGAEIIVTIPRGNP
jgi:PAS domain S-box-containing protein